MLWCFPLIRRYRTGTVLFHLFFFVFLFLFDVVIPVRECIDMVFGQVTPDGDGFGDGIDMPCNVFMG